MATARICVSFIFSLCISLSITYLASAFSPSDHYLVNCGSDSAETLDQDHRIFTGDDSSKFLLSTRTSRLVKAESHLDSSSPLYQTARGFSRPAHYVFPISDRGTHHLVRLHFHPHFTNSCCNCFEVEFHVVANGFVLLNNFRIPNDDGLPIIKEFVIPVDFGKLEITFIPSKSSKFGFVNAIEVISAPKDLIADVAQFVDTGKVEWVDGLLRNGFETVHRVNVGGYKVTPFNDSLWRTWVTDDKYLQLSDGSEKIHFGGRIQYQMGGASREVGPDNVYNTARIIKSSDNSNVTLAFELEKGHRYMVRMHFCDIASVSLFMIYFNVYMNGNLAYENLDLSSVTNGLLASPFYADFVVDGEVSENLVVSVGPSNMSRPHAVNGLVNGIEVWKMNNSIGSFGGEVSAEYVWWSWRREHAGVLLPLVAAVFLLLIASVFMVRKRNGYVGWSRLPVDVSETSLKFSNQFTSVKT